MNDPIDLSTDALHPVHLPAQEIVVLAYRAGRAGDFDSIEKLKEASRRVLRAAFLLGAEAVHRETQNEYFLRGERIENWYDVFSSSLADIRAEEAANEADE